MSEFTQILARVEGGDPQAAAALLPIVYEELRRLAARKMAREAADHTLQPTALVHEAWMRLGGGEAPTFRNRAHFFGAAAEAMRRILVESARRKRGPKRGGHLHRADADLDLVAAVESPVDLLALDEALTRLAAEVPARAELVKLRFFAGLTMPEAAEVLGVSLATAERHWTFAKAWLFDALGGTDLD